MDAKIKNENSLELIIELDVKDTQKLPDLAFAMESQKKELGFLNFGFSKTTIEDVFLRIGDDRVKESTLLPTKSFYLDNEVSNKDKLTGSGLIVSHLIGLFVKRMLSTLRMWRTYIFLTLFSIAIVVLLAVLINNPSKEEGFSVEERSFSSFQSYEDSNTLLLASSLGKDIQDNVENFISTENIATTLYTAENVTEYILNIANEDLTDYSRNFIVGFKNSKNDKNQFYSDKQICENVGSPPDNMLTVMYNPVPLHSRPLAINILSNVILKTLGKKAVIKMTSKPIVINTFVSISKI